MPVGIVLSGGGSRGDFEVGALRALYNRGVRPDIVCGTSVGAINGAAIAQGEGGLEQLETIWLALQSNTDMYLLDPALEALPGKVKEFLAIEIGRPIIDLTLSMGNLAFPLGFIADAISTGMQLADIAQVAGILNTVKSLYNLNPIKDKLNLISNLDSRVAASGIKLRLVMVGLESGALRFVDEQNRLLDEKGQVVSGSGPVALVDAVLASASIPFIFPPVNIPPENFVDGGVRSIIPIRAALDAGADHIFAIVASRSGVDPASSFDSANILTIAERAAADIMPDQIQQDGTNPGGRGWGSDVRIIAPLGLNVHDTMTVDPGLISIAMAYGFMSAAIVADFYPTDLGTLLKFIGLNDEVRKIIELRKKIWDQEYDANGQLRPGEHLSNPQLVKVPDPDVLRFVRTLKTQLHDMIVKLKTDFGKTSPEMSVLPAPGSVIDFGQVPVSQSVTRSVTIRNTGGGAVPPDADTWFLGWERHPWAPFTLNPWDDFPSRAGDVPPATPPPGTGTVLLNVSISTDNPVFFRVSSSSAVISEGGAFNLGISFTPTTVGTRITDQLVINSNVPGALPVTLTLTGTGAPPPPTMSVKVRLTKSFGVQRTIMVTVTDAATGAAIQGATVTVLDDNGAEQTTGVTDSQGAINLTYRRCFDFEQRKPVPCEGTVSKGGYPDAGFAAPS